MQGFESAGFDGNTKSLLETFGANNIFWASPQNGSLLPDGPYFATVSGLHQAWRLYDDQTNSFVLPTVPSVDNINAYEVLPVKDTNPLGSLSIAVPSRLYYKPTPEQPLAGYRVAVKDQYAIKGLITTFGSRSYAMTYPPSNVTSAVIQNLIDLGAIIVGKTKLSLFANPLFTAAQWPDYSLPFVCPLSTPILSTTFAYRERTPAATPISFLGLLLLAQVLPWLRTIGLTIVLERIQEVVSRARIYLPLSDFHSRYQLFLTSHALPCRPERYLRYPFHQE